MLQYHYRQKQRREGHQVGENALFLGRQKFLADGVAGDPKIWPGEKNQLVWTGSSPICYLN